MAGKSKDSEMNIIEALRERHSVRAFQSAPVDPEMIRRILALASRAPSGSNLQPWKVWVVSGAARDRLCAKIHAAHMTGAPAPEEGYGYFPEEWFEPALTLRRRQGKALYAYLGIAKDDKTGMHRQSGRNYLFFDAPAGLFFTIDRRHGQSAWIDMGAFLQSIMVAARAFGLDTCPQQAFSKYHRLIREELPIPEGDILVCGMAIGYADRDAHINRYASAREPVESFTTFVTD